MRYLNAPFMISAHSSGSIVSASAVDPFTSQKSTLTMRRSPSMLRLVRALSSLFNSSLGMYCWSRARAGSISGSLAAACRAPFPVAGAEGDAGTAEATATGVPQCWQNLAPGERGFPQLAHGTTKAIPQLVQNLAASGLIALQLGQFTG